MFSKNQENNDVAAIATTLSAMQGSGDFAAIAATLLQYFGEPHDVENMVLTIRRKDQWLTPWNTKLLGFNNLHK